MRLGKYQAPTTYVGRVLQAIQTPPLKASNQQKSALDRSNILKLAKIRFDSYFKVSIKLQELVITLSAV